MSMAPIALVNRVFMDPMLLNIISSFHGDFRVEVKVLSLKRDWLAHFQELVRPRREQVEDILVWSMHRVERFFYEMREAYWEDASDRAPAIALPDIDRDEHSSFWGPEVIQQSPQALENMEAPESDVSPTEVADAGGDVDRDEDSSSWGPEFIHQSPQTLENLEVPESEFAPSEDAEDTSQLDRLPPEWIEWLDEKSVWSLFVCGRTTALSAAFLAYTGRMYLQH